MAPLVKRTVLCFVIDRARLQLLMIEKKRGQGAGKWNVPGGKLLPGEAEAAGAARETEEETGIRPEGLREAGRLEFYFPEGKLNDRPEGKLNNSPGSKSWDNTCAVFIAESFSGSLLAETDECTAHWIPLAAIPYDRMWDNDRLWVPLVFSGQPFHRIYEFDAGDQMKSEKILR